jgi:uncharacterized protein (DUF2249 family)
VVVTPMVQTVAEPIRASWKVSQVLQRHPDLLEVFVATDPAFSKLRNPVLRRVQSRLVTVEQAARIAGIDPSALVRTLNEHAGLEPATDSSDADQIEAAPNDAAPPWVESAQIAIELDVRPHQRRGEEPFGPIMEVIRQVPVGQVLVLWNTFDPIPLYDVLGMRGFEHWSRQDADNEWEIRFYNTGRTLQAMPSPATQETTSTPLDWSAPNATVTIDVSDLVPPEPMVRVLEALEELPAGESLLVYHLRRPMHLYPRLDELGCRHETREIEPGRVEVLIQKPTIPAGGGQ